MKKIRNKIVGLVVGGIVATLLPLLGMLFQGLQHQAVEDLKHEALVMAEFISNAVSAAVDLEDQLSVELALEHVKRKQAILLIEISTIQGEMLNIYQSRPLPEIDIDRNITTPYAFQNGSDMILAIYPIPSPVDYAEVIGTLVLGISTDSVGERIRHLRMAGLSIGALMLVLGVGVAWMIGTWFARPVVQLSQVARQIADGDLSETALQGIRMKDEIGEFARSFDYMRESLNQVLGHLRTAGLKMQASSDAIFMAVNQLAAALEQQSASVIETTATMESMTATSRKISGNTETVAKMVGQTRTNSQKGVAIAEETMEKMREIDQTNTQFLQKITTLGERSDNIGDVIQIIHDIADRTKLIAFNAALEAADTKDIAGKRFNVVAVEIRRLADTTIESIEDIEANIFEIQQGIRELVLSADMTTMRIAEGTRHTQNTAAWLQEILDAATHADDEAKQISYTIQEQQYANEQILLALKEISDGTKQFVSAGNKVSASADEMKHLAEEFYHLIDRFDLETEKET